MKQELCKGQSLPGQANTGVKALIEHALLAQTWKSYVVSKAMNDFIIKSWAFHETEATIIANSSQALEFFKHRFGESSVSVKMPISKIIDFVDQIEQQGMTIKNG